MCTNKLEGVWHTHLAEYGKLRDEICLRIQLQDRSLHYALIVCGFFAAALGTWVLRTEDDTLASISDLRQGDVNLKGIILTATVAIVLQGLTALWIYQTYMCLTLHAYLTCLKKRMENTLQPCLFNYQTWRFLQSPPNKKSKQFPLLKRFQPAPIYLTTLAAIVGLWWMCWARADEGSSWWYIPPSIVSLLYVGLLLAHIRAQQAGKPNSWELWNC